MELGNVLVFTGHVSAPVCPLPHSHQFGFVSDFKFRISDFRLCRLVARRSRSIAELAGCLRTVVSFPGLEAEKQALAKARAAHYAKEYGQT